MSDLLRVEHLTKVFTQKGKEIRAVDDLSFCLGYGETLGLVGESGCGKSTTGRLVLNLLRPTSGKVLFEGQDIYELKKKEFLEFRKNAQIIFQDCYASLSPRFRVGELIEEALAIHHIGNSKKERREMAARIFEDVTLSPELLDRYPHEFSGGQRQRIGIARAVCLNPKMVVCDEPVSALDVSIQAQIINMMKEIQAKYRLSYIFISHDLSVVKHISDRVIVMYLGQIVEYADKRELFGNAQHPYTQALLSSIPVADTHHRREKIVLKNEANYSEYEVGCRFADRCWRAKKLCHEQCPALKEISPGHFAACHCL